MAAGELLTNVVLSRNPCPSCKECNGLSMTYQEWIDSQWGLPCSSGRICETNCHCILVPENLTDQLPDLGTAKIRGDEGTDIAPIVEITPAELELEGLLDQLFAKGLKWPKGLIQMENAAAIEFLKSYVAGGGAGGFGAAAGAAGGKGKK